MDDANLVPNPPVLYSFRRCPYAIRARMALAYADIVVELREVVLRNKPAEMLEISPKGSVPVMLTSEGKVIDESIDIIHWALAQSDPEGWLSDPVSGSIDDWIQANDGPFKALLDRYKYADRFPEHSASHYRYAATDHLQALDDLLRREPWLHGERTGIVDVALFPFVRQFAMVDEHWFASAPLPGLRRWLFGWLEDPRFLRVMKKYAPWEPGQPRLVCEW